MDQFVTRDEFEEYDMKLHSDLMRWFPVREDFARLQERVEILESKIFRRFSAMDEYLFDKFRNIDERFQSMDERLHGMKKEFGDMKSMLRQVVNNHKRRKK